MTEPLYRADPYRKSASAHVKGVTAEGGIILDRTLFYPQGGGQPGDSGTVVWEGGRLPIATTIKGIGDDIIGFRCKADNQARAIRLALADSCQDVGVFGEFQDRQAACILLDLRARG